MTFYHGTRRGFKPGGYLLPRAFHEGRATAAPLSPGCVQPEDAAEYVYITESEDLAWAYAWCSPGRGRPKVLVVEPTGPVVPDSEHSPAMLAYRTTSARVVAVHIEPLMTEAEAREGWVMTS